MNEQHEPLTLREFNRFCEGLDQRFMRIEGNQVEIKEDIKGVKSHLKDLNGGVGDLERWQHRVIGATAVVILLLTVFGATVLGFALYEAFEK